MPGRTPKKQSTLSNKKALNLVVENNVEDEYLSTTINLVDDNLDEVGQDQKCNGNNLPSSSGQPKATLTIKHKQMSPETPKSVKTLKMKDDTKSSKKKKNESVKRKRANNSEEIVDVDESHFISTKGKQADEIIGSVASIFLTKEQRQRKKEIETQNELQKTQEKKKEINSIFCVQGAEHPLIKINKERNKESNGAKSQKHIDVQSWQGVEPLHCNMTTENLREFGFCQNVGLSIFSTNPSQSTINIDDLLLPDSPTDNVEYSKSFENHPNTSKIVHKLSQYNTKLVERLVHRNSNIEPNKSFNNYERISFEENTINYLEFTIEDLYPQPLWKESKSKAKHLLKKLLDRKCATLPESTKVTDLDGENSVESTNSIDSSYSKKDILDDMWSTKYKPNCYDQIISKNENSNRILREWLEKWKSPVKKQSKRKESTSKKRKSKKSEDDLFTDDEYEDDELEKCILLYGPTSGKSSSLQAIATQLGFDVMEINSACDRSSKSIMELKETTQSKVINSMGKIIVFEDADLKFQEESYNSFISSVEKLEKSAKRPIILISDTYDENNLLNSICKQRVDYCCRDPFTICTTETINQHCKYILDVCVYLESILLCEGIKLDIHRDLFPLVVLFSGDLKKILLHLQFWFYRANQFPTISHSNAELGCHSSKSLLEKILNLDKFYYENTIDKFRQAEDDFNIMKELDISFYNYLNNSKSINSKFISTLSDADTLRRFDDEFSCKVSAGL